MAEAAVSLVVHKLGDLLVQEAIYLHGVRSQVEWLNRELRRMQCFLKDADAKRKRDERVKNWVRDIRDVAYEAEDIIDMFMVKVARRRRGGGFIGFLERYVFILDEMIARRRTGMEIESVKARILEISNSRVSYGIANLGETEGTTKRSIGDTSAQALVPLLSQLDDTHLVGFDMEKKLICKKLLDQNDKSRSVISIVGMGGLGKTTLARSIYNHIEIKRNFPLRAWVTISQEYKLIELVKTILSAIATIPRTETENVERFLIEKLHEVLKQSKYLIVLDDVWSGDVWDPLKLVFPDVENGSRVIMTTRFLGVAKYADPSTKPHELRLLDEQESWELFLTKAFPKQDVATCCPVELVELGHQLAHRCGGLPLALVAIGGLMSMKERSYSVWLKVTESMSWRSMLSGGERCLEILALSYNDLPYYLKSCFLYLGAFPEDYIIDAERLIRLWTAEGFIPAKDEETLEESADACLEELVQRCMVQVVSRGFDGTVRACRLHDLMHDLIISEVKEDGFFYVYTADSESMPSSDVARRLVIYNKRDEFESLQYSNMKLRSLLGFNLDDSRVISLVPPKRLLSIFSELELLRVIDLWGARLLALPSGIKSMIHLRYLGLRATGLQMLPTSVGRLRNLQTIDVRDTGILELPEQLWRIETLRHVFMGSWLYVGAMRPPKISKLKNLQNLEGIGAGDWIEHELQMLSNLRKLNIHEVSEVHASALTTSLNKLGRLASLSILGDRIPSDSIITAFQDRRQLNTLKLYGPFINKMRLPSSQAFPPRLVELSLERSFLEIDPMLTLEKLPYLRALRLCWCYRGKQMTCSAGGFSQLQDLRIEDMDEFEEWRIEKDAMPHLKSLLLERNRALKVVPEGLKFLTMLEELEFQSVPNELIQRVKEGEDRYKIDHVPIITINGNRIL